jgi:hypothetical protein
VTTPIQLNANSKPIAAAETTRSATTMPVPARKAGTHTTRITHGNAAKVLAKKSLTSLRSVDTIPLATP